VLAFFGFINGTELAFGNSAPVALGYAVLGVVCLAFGRAKLSVVAPQVEVSPADAMTEQA
jgi:uncharacterized membrane protein